ncbi:Crp/Fnr family transcriptional regulator [Pseudomonadota bacterium]
MNISLLKNVPLFAGLSEDLLGSIAIHGVVRNVPRNNILLHEGEQPDALYIVVTGKVKIYVGDVDGKELVLSILGPGGFFGEMAIIDGSPRSATVMSVEESTVVTIGKQDFLKCLREIPDLAFNLLVSFARRIRNVNDHVRDLALLDVYGRVARTLLRLAKPKENILVTDAITQQEIANMVGASREMVSRVLTNLKNDGFISIAGKQITICDPPALDI